MPLESLLAFFGAMALVVMLPGPAILGLVGWTLGRGKRAALGFAIGVLIGDWIFLGLASLGLASLAQTMGEAFLVVKLAGAAYLIFMGARLWRSRPMATDAASRGGSMASALLAGLTTTLANPKTIMFFMGILPMIVDMGAIDGLALGELALTIGLVLLTVMTPYTLAADRARRLLKSPRALGRLNKGAGALLIGTGAFVVAK